jgi:hypothetical protein
MRAIEAIGQLSFVCGEDGEGRSGMMKCEAPPCFRVELFLKAYSNATHFQSCA